MALMLHSWWIAQSGCLSLSVFGLSRLLGMFSTLVPSGQSQSRPRLPYLLSFDREEFRVPGAAATLGFALVKDEGFVAFFKQLLNAIGGGSLGIGPSTV